MKRLTLILTLAVAAALMIGGATTAQSKWDGWWRWWKSEEPPSTIAAGVSVGAPAGPAYDDYERKTGHQAAVFNWFMDWGGKGRNFIPEHFNAARDRGMMPMISWYSSNYEQRRNNVDQPDMALSTIIAGEHDAFIRQWARDAASYGHPFYLRFNHEMNGDWYPWSAGVNGNTAQEYVAAWRHVHDIFQQEGATNVKWVWNPNVHWGGDTATYSELYPGDAYVDWVGLDGYNWGGSKWHSFYEIFHDEYNELVELTDKPIMISEFGSEENGGDKAYWLRQAYQYTIPNQFPEIKAVLYFNTTVNGNWRVDSSPEALDAYKTSLVNNPYYSGRMP